MSRGVFPLKRHERSLLSALRRTHGRIPLSWQAIFEADDDEEDAAAFDRAAEAEERREREAADSERGEREKTAWQAPAPAPPHAAAPPASAVAERANAPQKPPGSASVPVGSGGTSGGHPGSQQWAGPFAALAALEELRRKEKALRKEKGKKSKKEKKGKKCVILLVFRFFLALRLATFDCHLFSPKDLRGLVQ